MLLERDVPLQCISELAAKLGAQGAIALVSGEAGIGKTTFLRAFVESLDEDLIVRWGSCDPLTTPRVLGPFHDMVLEFGPKVQAALENDRSFSRLVSALLEELQTTAKPSVMVIEDAHWADNATLDLIKCISRRISFLNILLVISYRTDEINVNHPLHQCLGDFPHSILRRFNLAPLSEHGVALMATAAGKSSTGLHTVTAGNPFYITEHLAGTPTENYVPDSIQDAVGARINRLESAHQQFLETISVIPNKISSELVSALFDPKGPELLNACVQGNFLKTDGEYSYRFRHELARLGTLSRVPKYRQQEFHKRIFSILDNSQIDATIDQKLYHADEAGLSAEVLMLAQLAGQHAAETGSHAEAASHYATALRYIDCANDEITANIYECWSYESALLAIDDETIQARHKALELRRKLGHTDKIGENLRWLSRQHWYRGESELANRYIADAISTLEKTEPSAERAMAYSLNSQFHMLNDRVEEAIEFGEKALELEQRYPSSEVRTHALCNIGSAKLIDDDQDGLLLLEQSLEVALENDFHEHAARVYTNTATGTVWGLDYDAAQTAIADGIAFDTEHDLDSWTYYLIGLMAQLKMEQSRFEEADTIAAGALQVENQTLLMKLPALLVLARVRLRMRKTDSTELMQKALADSISVGEPLYICPAYISMIEQAWHEGNDENALAHIEQIKLISRIPINTWRGAEIGIWMHRYGVELAIKSDTALPLPYQLEVDGHFDRACDEWVAKGNPYRGAVCLMHTTNDNPKRHYQRALDLLEPCHAAGTIEKLRNLAEAHGYTDLLTNRKRGPRKEARRHPLGLTAKEQAILAHIVEGRSNREMSEILSRSQRTVENHVASILRKMNVKNRIEAMLRVKTEPWLLADQTAENAADLAEQAVALE